ncbi:NAD(P)-dependent alcohol dehydrogenase [Candidatus Poribacteria bacterium]|nr:MAG: NAD(P)-dependent alcohol dehydrogenase [Candidatus Poribacteria bacterium]
MKAAVLHKVRDIRIEELPKPQIVNDDDVLVRVKAVGVCGSDIHFYMHGRIGDFVVEKPLILGHESAGIVEEVGKGVKDLKPGDKVALEPGIPCRRCEFCKSGRYNLCPHVRFFAAPPVNGVFAEYVVHPADFCFKLPENASLEEGAMVEPLSVGLHGAILGGVRPGDWVAVLGSGPIGLMALQASLAMGASRVICVDLYDFRLKLAKELGASETINAKETDPVEAIADLTGGRGVDVVFEAAGVPKTSQQAIEIARPGGTIVHIGLGEQEAVPMNIVKMIFKELRLQGIHRYANIYPRAIKLIASGRVKVKPMITARLPLERVEEALRMPVERPDSTIKVIVEI